MTAAILLVSLLGGGDDYSMFDTRISKVESKISDAEKQIQSLNKKLDKLTDRLDAAEAKSKVVAKGERKISTNAKGDTTICENGVCKLQVAPKMARPSAVVASPGMTYPTFTTYTESESSFPTTYDTYRTKRGIFGVPRKVVQSKVGCEGGKCYRVSP